MNDPGQVQINDAVTLGVRNVGGMASQELAHMPHTWFSFNADVTFTETSNGGALDSGVISAQQYQGVFLNYMILQPSVRGNTIHCLVGGSKMNWKTVNGICYPDGSVRCSNGSQLFTFPARNNWSFAFVPYLNPVAAGYQDAFTVILGYLPTNQEFLPAIESQG